MVATTESRNPASVGIDMKSTREIIGIINSEDKKVPEAVSTALDEIAYVTDLVVESFRKGGRLFYVGAGTSGRLGVLDASECPPTYGVDPSMVQGIIAGGPRALTISVEGAEDDGSAAVAELRNRGLNEKDTVIGITANGGAPFVVEALKYAVSIGAGAAAISSNKETAVFAVVPPMCRIYVPVGPEIVTGSTRMKSGTAQKLTLNMITTASMIRLGKVFNNLMVDLRPVNTKLVARSIRMIEAITGVTEERAAEAFEQSAHTTKTAIVMAAYDVPKKKAEALLAEHPGLGNLFASCTPVHIADEFNTSKETNV